MLSKVKGIIKNMKKLAIIGASYLQLPLIERAKKYGIETHVFAWKSDDVGEKSADYFYPISIVEKEAILFKCREIGIDGICSIASDLAAITVNYVACAMGLVGNSLECVRCSTNKYAMRKCFEQNSVPSPKSIKVKELKDLEKINLKYPLIVKPVDRSGSRGITKLELGEKGLEEAVHNAKQQGFEKIALVEEFCMGQEYSVECISWKGKHTFLAITQKYTTGSPNFIEMAHLEPAQLSEELLEKVKKIVFHALDSLKFINGASHSEVKISKDGEVKVIEIGGRMGGDYIGSHLVQLSTGVDFVYAVIQVALNERPDLSIKYLSKPAAIRYILSKKDMNILEDLKRKNPEYLLYEYMLSNMGNSVIDSSTRWGFFLFQADTVKQLKKYIIIYGGF